MTDTSTRALAASLKARTGEDAGGAKAGSAESAKAPKPKRKPPAKRAGTCRCARVV